MNARRAAAAAIAGVTFVLASAAPAAAHSVLLATAPADGGTVTVVTTEVTMTFNEPVKGSFSTVAVIGPGGRAYGNGALRVVDNVVHQPVYVMGSGAYRVAWRVVSADGHPVSGSFSFTVALPENLEPTALPSPTVAASLESTGSGRWWSAGLAVIASAAVILVFAARRRRAK